MSFDKLVSFNKSVSSLADKPAFNSYQEAKAAFDAAPDEVRVYLNKLIDALKKVTKGDSGANNIGATTISGLSGSDVQTILESLKTELDKKAIKDDIGNFVSGSFTTFSLNAGQQNDLVINYPNNKFSAVPNLTYSLFCSDVDGAYTTASSIIANSSKQATIRVKNKASGGFQYYIVYWRATDK